MVIKASRASDLIGRQVELALLSAALDGALSGRGQIAMLAGEPGIGKTRLAQELASHALTQGVQVLWGGCYEREGAPSYWPWLQAIRQYVGEIDAERLRQEMGPGASDIARVLPELLLKIEGLEPPPAPGPEQARFRFFVSITTLLKNLSQVQPLVLMLEDLHWADESSLLLLEFLVHEIGSSRILVIGTYRDVEITSLHALTETLGTLVLEDHFLRVQLDGLSRQEVGELVVSKTGVEARQDAVVVLHQRTEGNPLFVGEVVGSISPGQLAGDLAWTHRMPEAVRDAIARRLRRLSKPCVSLLDTASVIGRDFDFELLRTLSPSIPENVFLESLDEALGFRVIELLPERLNRYRFNHALIQQAVYEKIPHTRKMRAHAATAEALERLHEADLGEHAAELVHHFAEARGVTGEEKVVEYSLIAGEKALESFAYEEALIHFRRVLDSKGKKPVDGETAQALFGLGRAQSATLPRHELMEAHLNLRHAFDFYAAEGDLARLVAIAELPVFPLAEHGISTGSLVEQALELVPRGSPEAGRLHAFFGNFLGLERGDYWSAQASFGQALRIARQEGNAALEMRTLNYAAQVELWHHKFKESLESGLKAIDLAAVTSDPRGEVIGRYWVSLSARALGDIREGQRQASAISEPAERLRDRYWLATAQNTIAWPPVVQGDWNLAREENQRGLEFMPLDPRNLLQRVILEAQNGDRNQAEIHLKRLEDVVWKSDAGPTTANASLAFASPLARSLLGAVGRPDIAESSITSVLLAPTATPFFSSWARVGAALLAVINDDTKAAGEHYAALKPLAGVMVLHITVDRVMGLLAGVMGNLDDAAAHFREASEFCRKAGQRPELAWTCYNHASVLVKRARHGDREKAASLLREGLSIATELAMTPLRDKAAAVQKKIGPEPGMSPPNLGRPNASGSPSAYPPCPRYDQPRNRQGIGSQRTHGAAPYL